ncbi:MAG: hypothetical protein KDC43_13795 [Saprospiraceae bacterium]|nr:hypothetical protein [Saprospiraceae bacterium]MCB0624947.1 hypothetical protein [Saprospiraceae bacterium]MCB0682578.1 hypothetical protein [Saprospiraceae bacterium]
MQTQIKEYTTIFWLHFAVLFLLILSWLLLSWWVIIIAEVLLQVQYFTTGCVMSKAEFDGSDEAAIPYYLSKWGIIKDKRIGRRFIRDILPVIVILLALWWQISLGKEPLLF